MDQVNLLAMAIAEEFVSVIDEWRDGELRTQVPHPDNSGVPKELRWDHLLWMCREIIKHADDWPATKLHRWIGFIHCGMMANGMMTLEESRAIVGKGKIAFSEGEDRDLADHHDPENPFQLDIGVGD